MQCRKETYRSWQTGMQTALESVHRRTGFVCGGFLQFIENGVSVTPSNIVTEFVIIVYFEM